MNPEQQESCKYMSLKPNYKVHRNLNSQNNTLTRPSTAFHWGREGSGSGITWSVDALQPWWPTTGSDTFLRNLDDLPMKRVRPQPDATPHWSSWKQSSSCSAALHHTHTHTDYDVNNVTLSRYLDRWTSGRHTGRTVGALTTGRARSSRAMSLSNVNEWKWGWTKTFRIFICCSPGSGRCLS